MTKERKNWAVWISIAAIIIVAAAFMPWGEIQASPSFSGLADDFFGSNPFGGMPLTLTVNGWNGTVTFAGIQIPNWTVVLLALAVAALGWLIVTDAWQPPRFLAPALAVVALLQVLLTLIVLEGSGKSSVGIGILVTAVGVAAMSFASCALAMQRPAPAP